MSEVQNTPATATAEASEPVVAAPAATEPQAEAAPAAAAESAAPAAEEAKPEAAEGAAEPSAAAAAVTEQEEKKDEATPAAVAEKKPVEPITEGLLGYKGPGLVKYAHLPDADSHVNSC